LINLTISIQDTYYILGEMSRTKNSELFVSAWYDLVKDYTFPRDRYVMGSIERDNFEDHLLYIYKENPRPIEEIIREEFPYLAEFFEKALKKWSQGVFVRWDDRSPKDYWFYFSKSSDDIKPKPLKTVEKIFEVLLNSERLVSDIIRGTFNGVIWVAPFIQIDHEMRGFVYRNGLFALSQYYYEEYDHLMSKYADWYAKAYYDLWLKVRGRLEKFENYVIDFGWDKSNREPIVIELNPFDRSTDPCLFSWKELHELKLQNKFVVRVNELKPKELIFVENGQE